MGKIHGISLKQDIRKNIHSSTLCKQVTIGELQREVKNFKSQVKELQHIVHQQQLEQLQINAKIALIEPNFHKSIPTIPSTSNPEKQIETNDEEEHIQIIDKINYQKYKNHLTYRL